MKKSILSLKKNNQNSEVAIKVEKISKTFRIPHEKHTSLKSAVLNVFKKKSYTKLEALNEVTFEVKRGEFFGIIGRNGSGKSTLLKMLAGIYTPDSGKITINGKLSPFLELGVGFNPELTARENVYLGGAILGLTRKEIDEKFDEIISFAELKEFVDMKFKNFSSGMQVRLAFALSINAHAEILLMDEVLAVGDSNFQAKCLREFNNYKQQGKTVVLVSHDIGTIQKYCDRAMLLKNGSIIKLDGAASVVDEYIQENIEDTNKLGIPSVETEIAKQGPKIGEVTLVDKKGASKRAISIGDDIDLNIKINSIKKGENINVGIGLYSDNGSYVFGYNTQMDKFEVKGKSITFTVQNSPILKGSYYFNVVIFGDVEEKFYDFKARVVQFEVFPSSVTSKYRGIVNVPHGWSQK